MPVRLAMYLALLVPAVSLAGPDPRTVVRHGAGYRYRQAGWIVVHLEGKPHERGEQHGYLLADEIADHIHCFAATLAPKAPAEGWNLVRTLTNATFLRGFTEEYLQEMKGIADGASAAGARFEGRRLDVIDIAGLNLWPEIDTLDAALNATATDLDKGAPSRKPRTPVRPKPSRCSAFAATGPATRDGKIVFGHITMFSLYPANFYNVWLDIKPEKGRRVVMQSFPGGIHSGMDYYLNDAGLMILETTIGQTPFDGTGTPLSSRIRQAIQYSETIDQAVAILKKGNNGLYTNEWLLGDTKTNEIAMFELGTHKTRLWRSSKNEWFADTEGFYWGCNNTKDLEVRLETRANLKGKPGSTLFIPSERDKKWVELYEKHRGKMDVEFGKLAFTTPPLAASSSLDAKVTTSDLARQLQTVALFGPPLGRTWQPSFDERTRYPQVRPLVSNPWTLLGIDPSFAKLDSPAVVDLGTGPSAGTSPTPRSRTAGRGVDLAWRGTILARGNEDLWLAAAWPVYERIIAGSGNLGVALHEQRALYEIGIRSGKEVPLSEIKPSLRDNSWARIAQGKGVLLLHALRSRLGADTFDDRLDAFGLAHAGKEVTAAEFQKHLEGASKESLAEFFGVWLHQTGLPSLDGLTAKIEPVEKKWALSLTPGEKMLAALPPLKMRVDKEKTTQPIEPRTLLDLAARPESLVLDPACEWPVHAGPFTITSFYPEVEKALIVYGTLDEEQANREAADTLQTALIRRGANWKVPIRTDRTVTEDELKGHHLLLVGRPSTNRLTARLAESLPVHFATDSVVVDNHAYAHARTELAVATENPHEKRYSVVVLAGLSGEATLNLAGRFGRGGLGSGEVVLMARGRSPVALVLPRKELTKRLDPTRGK